MRKMCPFSKRLLVRIQRSKVKLDCKKLLGNDGKTTGYMEISGEPEEFQKLAKKGLFIRALCWNPENEVCDTWISKRQPQSSPSKVRHEKRFMDTLAQHLPAMPQVASLVKGNDKLEAVIVKALAPAAQVALHEHSEIHSSTMSGLYLAVFTKEDWRKHCMNFMIIAKFSHQKNRWAAKTVRAKKILVRKSPLAMFNRTLNAMQENRYSNQPYDGRRPGEKQRVPKMLKEAHKLADSVGNRVTVDAKTGKALVMHAADRQQLFEKIVGQKTFDKLLDAELATMRPESERK